MKATLFVLGAIGLLLCCTPTSAQTSFAKLTVSSYSVNFGDHDIGTVTPAANPLILSNNGDAAVTFSVTSLGPNSDDFLTDNPCGDKLPAKGQCAIKVAFSPRLAIEKDTGVLSPNLIARKKTLVVNPPVEFGPCTSAFVGDELHGRATGKPRGYGNGQLHG